MSRSHILLTFVFIAFCLPALAQGPPPPPPLNEVPLDGFTTALLAAGVGYGIRRTARKRE